MEQENVTGPLSHFDRLTENSPLLPYKYNTKPSIFAEKI